jgi:hypothetical protein
MRNIVAFALLFVFSFADFGQKVTLQTRKVKPKPVVKAQKVKPKTAAKTEKIKSAAEKTKPKVAAKKQETKPKTEAKPKVETKPKVEAKSKTETKVKAKTETKPEITTLEAKTADGKDITLKSNGTWAYKKPEPTPKPSPVAKIAPTPTPTATLVTIAKTTSTPKTEAKQSPTPVAKPSPIAKTKPSPTPSQCDLALQDAPLIRGLRLGMTRDEADGIIPGDRITIVDSSDIVSYPQYSRARGFENVYQISAQFHDNRLSALEIVYDPDDVKWKSAKDFAESLSTSLKLSPQFWRYNAKNPSSAQMQCREFSIKIDSTANEISLQKITPEQKTAQETTGEKKIFKP